MCEICESMRGTCNAAYEWEEATGKTEDEILEIVVECGEIERCDECSWWCEISELDENLICDDCRK